jgi:hypothetical protein
MRTSLRIFFPYRRQKITIVIVFLYPLPHSPPFPFLWYEDFSSSASYITTLIPFLLFYLLNLRGFLNSTFHRNKCQCAISYFIFISCQDHNVLIHHHYHRSRAFLYHRNSIPCGLQNKSEHQTKLFLISYTVSLPLSY